MILTLDSIPTELIMEILLRLPSKSIAMFSCVSKQWESILSSPYFTELFLTKSSAQPRKKGLLIPAKREHNGVPVVCNPNTGRYATLPYLTRYRKANSFFGFDPIDKQFKVLFIAYPSDDRHKILSLGTGKMKWRRIKCPLRHDVVSEGICINGVLYYVADPSGWDGDHKSDCVIVCFDVRSETFKWIYLESFCELINYNGKLGVIYLEDRVEANAFGLRVWVLEDLEKEEWSKSEYSLRDDKLIYDDVSECVSVVGVTATGEIILSFSYFSSERPFYVFYFNPETKTLKSVEIKGFGDIVGCVSPNVYTFVNHVEDLNVNKAKLLNSSIYAPYVIKAYSESEEEEEESAE
ncbi:unnamed protein product [Microthlaspi erraticum]|uniref:F-box domain-containing protein n=1 Tax=Microthlaspi erraticum TaxID=1685480 RepID=A0A6D2KK14_9BRAS|nr:unnamed protein product [Microthlaspi erraticum]